MNILEKLAILTCEVVGVTPDRLDDVRTARARREAAEYATTVCMRYSWPCG